MNDIVSVIGSLRARGPDENVFNDKAMHVIEDRSLD